MKKKGVTLVELIIAMGFIGIIIAISFNITLFSFNVHNKTEKEYELQSSVRLAADIVTNSIKYSTAIFTIPKTSFREDNLTEGWNYIGLSPDQKSIIQYLYTGDSIKPFETKILVKNSDDLKYDMKFIKHNPHEVDKLLYFYIEGQRTDGGSEKFNVESELEGTNTLQIVDRGTLYNPSVAIAYRSDERPTDKYMGLISMVLDKSGSMDWTLAGNTTSTQSDKRITKLKDEAKKLILELAKEENIAVGITPFDTFANSTKSFKDPKTEGATLEGYINVLSAGGGTNTGDGLRRGYYGIENYTPPSGMNKSSYMIILVDGVSTYATVTNSGGNSYKTNDGEGLYTKGNGSSYNTAAKEYVTQIGAKIKAKGIKTYVIGFSTASSDLDSVDDIADSVGAKKVYKFTTEGLDLGEVFEEIRQDIMKDLWHIRGPKL